MNEKTNPLKCGLCCWKDWMLKRI